jgi:hypothetical protein
MVATATTEATALARAVVEVTREVARMAQMAYQPDVPQRYLEDNLLAKEVLCTEVGLVAMHTSVQLVEEEEVDTILESEDDDDQQFVHDVVVVRSTCWVERRAWRLRAAKVGVLGREKSSEIEGSDEGGQTLYRSDSYRFPFKEEAVEGLSQSVRVLLQDDRLKSSDGEARNRILRRYSGKSHIQNDKCFL